MRAARLRVHADAVELVLDALLPELDHGVHERPSGPDEVELVVCAPPAEARLRAAAGPALRSLELVELPDDRAARRRALHVPRVVADRFHLRPAWAPPIDGLIDVALEDGPAFGTGAHPTTRMVLALLAEVPPHGAFLDLGCGSGVLSVAAAHLGFGPVTALDLDPEAVAATREAAVRNEVAIEVEERDLLASVPPAADVLAANVRLDVLEAVAAALPRPPRTALVSGIVDGEDEAALAAFAAHGLREAARRHDGGWIALRLEARSR